jgi:signal transduction histidine kinase
VTLAEFILVRRGEVVRRWTAFAATLHPGGGDATDLVLADHVDDLIDAIAHELEMSRTSGVTLLETAARIHTAERVREGYRLQQIVAEYRALRTGLVQMWRERAEPRSPAGDDMLDRMNDLFDDVIQASVEVHAIEIQRARELLLGTLGHDLRNPLNSISMRTAVLARMELPREAQDMLAPMRGASVRMGQLIGDLLDVTRVSLGSGLDLHRVAANLATLCAQSMEEVQAAYSSNLVRVFSTGDLRGFWDTTRIYQALTNLLGNAVQHGKPLAPITVTLTGEESTVTCAIQNWGPTISAEMLARIFEPMLRVQAQAATQPASTDSIGLGLYIAREIVAAHGGTLGVTSTDVAGTVFTMRLDRGSMGRRPERTEQERPDSVPPRSATSSAR